MFENLRLGNFTWRREPALWIALGIALLNVAASLVDGGLVLGDAVESAIALLGGFFIRGQVTPA